MGDRLRPLWDFDGIEASRERFLAQIAEETTDAGRAEVLTQPARAESLRDEFAGESSFSPPASSRVG